MSAERFLCEAIGLARDNVRRGGRPFGAVLVTASGHLYSQHGLVFHGPQSELHGVLQRHLLQSTGHALRDEFGVLGFALENEAESDDDIVSLHCGDHLGNERDLE